MSSKVEVDILLATFNGEEFLEELLHSLELQAGVELNIIVGDDGSSDLTASVLSKFSNSYKSMKVISYQRIGAARNFLSLLEFSRADFIAFADQDDIWDPHKTLKLTNAIKNQKGPVLAFGEIVPFPGLYKVSQGDSALPGLIHQNSIRGCSILINRSLKSHILNLNKNSLLMHDWASALLCRAIGKVIFVPEAKTFYRIHKGNVVGIPSAEKRFFSSLRGTLSGEFPKGIYIQAAEIYLYCEKLTKSTGFAQIKEWREGVSSGLFTRTTYAIRMRVIHGLRLRDATKICLGVFKFPNDN